MITTTANRNHKLCARDPLAEQLNTLLLTTNKLLADRTGQMQADQIAIEELQKQAAAIEVDLIRIKQRNARLQKKTDKCADPKQQPTNAAATVGRDQQMGKHLKLELLQRCTGLILDDSTAEGKGTGLSGLVVGVDDRELRQFGIAMGASPQLVEDELWRLMAESCGPGLAGMAKLFSEAKIVD